VSALRVAESARRATAELVELAAAAVKGARRLL
jgi:hypothetical protein